MSILESTVSMLESMPEDKLREVQNYIQYIIFREEKNASMELLGEEAPIEQLEESAKK